MRRELWFLLVVAIVIGAALYGFSGPAGQQTLANYFNQLTARRPRHALVTVGRTTVDAEVAATDATRQGGLAGRDSLGPGQGMLFVFDQPAPHSFWMQGMKFPLDIIWIHDGRVVEIAERVPVPTGTAPVITPRVEANQVLEVNAGFTERYQVTIGSAVQVNFDGLD
ncbi:MAG: DUF192 domain-containing protein [Candidatus Kerfeldbacteria bacterium]|nr:DUF192 domain-containing protein [Candidatus Kerfeldbacteria bacterium]